MTTTLRRLTLAGTAALALAACGASRHHTTTTATTTSPPDTHGWSGPLLARTLVAQRDVGVRRADCRPATAAEAQHTPFGPNPGLVYVCQVRTRGEPSARYVVQILKNNCFVAERIPPGRSIMGCRSGA